MENIVGFTKGGMIFVVVTNIEDEMCWWQLVPDKFEMVVFQIWSPTTPDQNRFWKPL